VIDVYNGWPDRYVLLAAPAFCLAYFAFELPGRPAINQAGRGLLFGLSAVLLPMNLAFGREWGEWYVHGMDRVIRDIDAGTPIEVLAARHNQHLYHAWEPARLADHMRMLRDQQIGPWGRGAPDREEKPLEKLDSLTVRYLQPDAGDVRLVWWLADGRRVPSAIRPAGTVDGKQGNAVSTPMVRDDSAFAATLAIAPDDTVEYGFLITGRNDGDSLVGIWDGTHRYQPDATEGDTIVNERATVNLLTNPLRGRDSMLTHQTIRYGPTDARRVRIIWGIDDWQQLPATAWPPRTRVAGNHLTLTVMERKGSMFETTLPVPAGRRLDFSFQLDRADRVEVSDDNKGRNYSLPTSRDSIVTMVPRLTRVAGARLSTVFLTGIPAVVVLGLAAGFSSVAGRLLRQGDRRP
jgi:hypothetical protein